MNLAWHIPILRNNPVFVLEAPRIWRLTTVLIAGAAVVILLMGIGGVFWLSNMSVSLSQGARRWLSVLRTAFPEARATQTLWTLALIPDIGREFWPRPANATVVVSCLAAILSSMSKYVVPILIGAAVARARAQRFDAEMAVTPLRARDVFAGIFWVAAWPAVAIWVGLAVVAAVGALDSPFRPLTYGLVFLRLLESGCVLVGAAGVAAAAAALCRSSYHGALLALVAAVGVETMLAFAHSRVLASSGAGVVSLPVFCVLHMVTVAAAFWLAARLWRRPSVLPALAFLVAFLGVMGAVWYLAPRPIARGEVAWLSRRLDSPSRQMREDAALLLAGRPYADAALRASIARGLIECLDDDSVSRRARAAQLLPSMYLEAEPALPRLRRMSDDEAEDPYVRRQADEAARFLELLGPPSRRSSHSPRR